MAKIITAPEPLDGVEKSIFLAGSIDMNKAVDWQKQLCAMMTDDDATLLNPRRPNWNMEGEQDISNPEFATQVGWELDALDLADVIVFYFDPAGKAPITLMELGLHASSGKCIVCCPEGYWRRGNVQVVCDRFGIPMVESIEDLVSRAREKIAQSGTAVITVDLDSDLLLDAALRAHDRNITLNAYFVECVQGHIDHLSKEGLDSTE